MVELGTCILCGFIGAGIAIIAQRTALTRYFDLVECLWSNDLKRIEDRMAALGVRIQRQEQR